MGPGVAPRDASDQVAIEPAGVAFVNVNVLPMDRDVVVPNQIVVVRGETIVTIGDLTDTELPPGALVVDGGGRYLIPGLYDLYTHVHEWALDLFLSNGVTTVRNTAPGLTAHLALREAVARGDRTGPRILTTGPVLDGFAPSYSSVGPVRNAREAEEVVAAQARIGYDGVMVYSGVEPLPYLAVLQSAARVGIPVSGHFPHKVPRELFFHGGQRSKENLIGEIDTATGRPYVPEQYLDADVRRVAEAGIWTIPTLTIHRMRAEITRADSLLLRPEIRNVPPRQREHWRRSEGRLYGVKGYVYGGAPDLVRRLHAAGAKVLAGSDAGYPFIVPGVSLHDELDNLVDAGLSRYEALRAATRDAAEYLGEEERAGTVAVGKRADLLLVESDPRQDLRTLRHPRGVMAFGRWSTRAELDERVERNAASLGPGRNRFEEFPNLDRDGGAIEVEEFEIFVGDVSVGSARYAVWQEPGVGEYMHYQAAIDPHLATRTEMRLIRDLSGQCDEIQVQREVAGARSEVRVRRLPAEAAVEAHLPFQEPIAWSEAIAEGELLGGPLEAVNVDLDAVLNTRLLIDRVRSLGSNGELLVPMKRVELNEEEHGRDGVVGDVVFRVAPEPLSTEPGSAAAVRFRIYSPGLNGSGISTILVELASDGRIVQISSSDGFLRQVRVSSH